MEPSFLWLQPAYLEGNFNILTYGLMWIVKRQLHAFLSTFNFCEFLSPNCKKKKSSHDFPRKPDCDIRIQLPQVSKEHCRIDFNENKEVKLYVDPYPTVQKKSGKMRC